jgi:predicted CopG family antitoxin
VDDAAEKLLKEKLGGSSFSNSENLSLIVRKFEEKVRQS